MIFSFAMANQSLKADPLAAISLSFVIGTLGVLAWLGVKAITGDFSCSRPWLRDQTPLLTCCYNGTCLDTPLPHKPLRSKLETWIDTYLSMPIALRMFLLMDDW